MPAAFATFDEAHAWLIRGLIDYGWPDTSAMGGHIPQGAPGGLNLSRFPDDDGVASVVLEVPAISGGRHMVEDGIYVFVVKLSEADGGGKQFVVRCAEANFLQEFAYDPANPSWTAGYIHQSVTEYVPSFVDWRFGGGELTWAQRAGMPEFEGHPCSRGLSHFIGDRLRRNLRIDRGPEEGWWMQALPSAPAPRPGFHAGMVTTGSGGGDPTFLSAAAQAAIAATGGEDFGSAQALAKVNAPGWGLVVTSSLGLMQGLFWVANAMVTVGLFSTDRVGATFFSIVLGMALLAIGGGAMLGANKYRRGEGSILVYLSMIYAAFTPICCLGGLPVAIWAMKVWRDPLVANARG